MTPQQHAAVFGLDSAHNTAGGAPTMSPLMWFVLFNAPGPAGFEPMTTDDFQTKEALERRGLVWIRLTDYANFEWRTTGTGRAARAFEAKRLNIKSYTDFKRPRT